LDSAVLSADAVAHILLGSVRVVWIALCFGVQSQVVLPISLSAFVCDH
jgi:hypothetical protein